ncbi:glutamate--tRNA ligase [Treponema sp. R6D11]
MKEVRTRFAPSPTGYMHIGNLRTALYAYLITKQAGGKFILRIEDTDQERLVEGAVDIIYNTLKSANLLWDEGPDIGGDYGPYIQSERKGLYLEYAKELVKKGGAYYCFCDKERLDEVRALCEINKRAPMYDGLCRGLSDAEVQEKLDAGTPYVIRQKMPKTGETAFDDVVYGKVVTPNNILDDNVLIKADGLPTYNFANVIDDHLMEITHVVRGNEYLSSTPKYNLLYESFGWDKPIYVHCPPVMRTSTQKLSKRDGAASYQDFIDKGYIPEAILNYIALLGWSSGEEREKFSLPELIEKFSFKGISKSPAIFDEVKLAWLNGEYFKDMPLQDFADLAKPYIEQVTTNLDYVKIAEVLKVRLERLADIPEQIDFLADMPDYEIDLYNHKKMKTNPEMAKPVIEKCYEVLKNENDYSFQNLHDKLIALVEELGLKNGQVLFPLRVALSGKSFTPGGGIEIASILGKDETLRRLEIALQKL